MNTIWKYELTHEFNAREIPSGFKILSVNEQFGKIVVHCMVNSENKKEKVLFKVVGTGFDIDYCINDEYIGTAMTQEGGLVWHVFMDKEYQ